MQHAVKTQVWRSSRSGHSRNFASTGISEAVWYEPVAWVWSKKVLRRGGICAYR